MKSSLFTNIIFIPVLFIFGCGTMGDTTKINPSSILELNNFSLTSPAEEEWHYSQDPENNAVMFYRGGWEKIGVSDLSSYDPSKQFVRILFARYNISRTITDENMNESDIFNSFNESLLKSVKDDFTKTGRCDIVPTKVDTAIIGNKKLMRQNYELFDCNAGGQRRNGVGMTFAYFPKDYVNKRVYYLFLFEEYSAGKNANELPDSLNYYKAFESIVESFNCKED